MWRWRFDRDRRRHRARQQARRDMEAAIDAELTVGWDPQVMKTLAFERYAHGWTDPRDLARRIIIERRS